MKEKGKLIVLEAGDASGKATQANLLLSALKQKFPKTILVSFPRYDSESSFLVRKYLSGELGDMNDITAKQAALFYAMDRFASYRMEWKDFYEDGGNVILDRYVPSNMVHQAARMMEDIHAEELSGRQKDFAEWVENLEYRTLNLPKPDGVIFLDMDIDVSLKLLAKRAQKQEKDIHERNTDYLRKVYRCYQLFTKYKGWFRTKCSDSTGNPLPMPEIHAWVFALARNIIQRETH